MKYLMVLGLLILSCTLLLGQKTNAFCEKFERMYALDQQYRSTYAFVEERDENNIEDTDSLMDLQITLDNQNTEDLIVFINENGWPNYEAAGCESDDLVWIIFRHSQKKYWDQIRTIIEFELQEGRISEWHYKLIEHHINGRPKK